MEAHVFKSFSRSARFEALVDCVQRCTLCERMRERPKVLSCANGSIEAKIVFVAEAPGRLGADRTMIPLHGDKAGDNFERLLQNMGWERETIFITNAILCNPRDKKGNNGTPTDHEIKNCSTFLEMTLELVDPDVVVTLGAAALGALKQIHPHSYTLRKDVRRLVPWGGRRLFIAYHPGQRATFHRSLDAQRADFYELSKWVDPFTGIKKRRRPKRSLSESDLKKLYPIIQATALLVSAIGKTTKFKLTKLLYLADFASVQDYGRSVTGAVYLREVDGPWLPAIDKVLKYLEGFEIQTSYQRGVPYVRQGPSPRFEPSLRENDIRTLLAVLRKYGKMSNAQIKTATYMTSPMRDMLRRERQGENLRDKPVLYVPAGR